jgi:hypothetical protein
VLSVLGLPSCDGIFHGHFRICRGGRHTPVELLRVTGSPEGIRRPETGHAHRPAPLVSGIFPLERRGGKSEPSCRSGCFAPREARNGFFDEADRRDPVIAEMGQTVPWSEWQLFNLREDPAEMNDLAQTHPKKLARLLDLWTDYVRTNGVVLPAQPGPY